MRRNPAILWCLALFSVALVCGSVFLIASFFPGSTTGAAPASAPSRPTPVTSPRPTAGLETLGAEKALQLTRDALNAAHPGQLENHFILGGSTSPGEAIRFLAKHRDTSENEEHAWLGGKILNNGYLETVLVSYEARDRNLNRIAQFWREPDGAWRIDFESFARRAIPGWPEILAGKAPVSIVRVFIREDTYYNGIFRNDSQWQSYSMVSPDIEETLFGYVERGSPQHHALARILGSDDTPPGATLELTKPPESTPGQFRISRVLAEGWSIRAQAFDGL